MPTCDRLGCSNLADWHPVLLLFSAKHTAPVQAVLGLLVCDQCRPTIDLDHVLSDEGWDQAVAALGEIGRAEPVRKLTRLSWSKRDHG